MEVRPPYHGYSDLLRCFPHITTLASLETLKYSVSNPVTKSRTVVPSTLSSLMFGSALEKLHLSGMGLPWKCICMDVIASLPLLAVLKLQSYAFRGSKWETKGGSFVCLKFLLIEDSDLVEWKPRYGSFPELSYVCMKHCYRLKKLFWPSNFPVGKIELVDCNPLAVTCAKKLRPRERRYSLEITASSSSFYEQPSFVNREHESDWSQTTEPN